MWYLTPGMPTHHQPNPGVTALADDRPSKLFRRIARTRRWPAVIDRIVRPQVVLGWMRSSGMLLPIVVLYIGRVRVGDIPSTRGVAASRRPSLFFVWVAIVDLPPVDRS